MPELPEVETVVRDLRPALVGRRITTVRVGKQKLRRPWQSVWSRAVTGKRVEAIVRRGKWIRIDLTGGQALILHLGMTGQLTVADSNAPKPNHTHLVFTLDDGWELRFRDVRRFGSVDLLADRPAAEHFLADRLGPEPFDLTGDAFATAVRSSIRSLKAILLDQAVVAGVGNIYADEACFRAGLHPARRGRTLSAVECDRLRTAIVEVLHAAIAGRGSTIRDYVGGSGLMGTYQGEFRVYGRTGEPCPICSVFIRMIRLAGRASHFCPNCQGRGPRRRNSIQ
jgi:formamidopyrimidine-DNA glycosylase